MPVLEAKKTPLTTRQVYDAFKRAAPSLSHEALCLAAAHSALESAWWRSCWNWNLGNARATVAEQHCLYPCGEELQPAYAEKLRAASPDLVTIVGPSKISGLVSVNFRPPHFMCRFRAFTSLDEAATDHMTMLERRFPKSWALLKEASADAYARELHEEGYYTASPDPYARGVVGCFDMVKRELLNTPVILVSSNTSNSSNDSPKETPMPKTFSFSLRPGESTRDRVWRCCTEVLADGPMGHTVRADWYASFINCNLKPAGRVGTTPVNSIASWATSCALFDRAIACACGRPTTVAVNASAMVTYMGVPEGPQHKAWIPNDGKRQPGLGDFGYWATSWQSNMGHTEVFGPRIDGKPGWYHTAGGGGGTDGTGCSMREKSVTGKDSLGRPLLGWFDVTKIGIPESEPLPIADLPKPTPILVDLPEPVPPAPEPPIVAPIESLPEPKPSPDPESPAVTVKPSGSAWWLLVVPVITAIVWALEKC